MRLVRRQEGNAEACDYTGARGVLEHSAGTGAWGVGERGGDGEVPDEM